MTDEAKLRILIEAHNKAKQAFDEVNSHVDKTEKRFESMSNKLEKVGDKMKDVGGKMTTRLTLPIIAGAGLAVKAFSDLNETMNKVEVSFGANAQEVKDWSKTSITSMGLAQQSALDAAALFGDMGTGMGQNTDEASKMSRNLTQLGADMASFKNVSFERAQTALAGVYTGETEALKSLGVVMTQTNLEEFAASKGITKKLEAMTQAEKVQLRYEYLMAKTANAQGDFARTSDGLANKTRMTAEKTKQLSAEFGEKLAPAMNKILDIGNKVLAFFGGLTEKQQSMILIFAAVVAALGPVIMIIGHLVTAIRAIGLAFSFLAANPVILAVVAIILVVAGLAYLIYRNWGTIKKFFVDLWKKVSDAFKSFTDWVGRVFGPIIDGIISAWQAVVGFFTDLWEGVKDVFNAVVEFFKKWGLTILAVIFWPFTLAVGLIITFWEPIKAFFTGVWEFIKAVFAPVIAYYTWLFTTAVNVIKTVWSVVVGFFSAIWEGIKFVFNAVVDYYRFIFTTAWEAIKAVWSVVSGWFSSLWQGIVAIFTPVVEFFSGVFSRAWNAITNVFSRVYGFFRGVWDSIVGMFSRIGTSVGDAISGAFKSAVNGVLSGAVNIINKVIGTINGATGAINKIPGVNIPKIGNLSVPAFYTGVRNFGGGLATVGDVRGKGGELVSLPRGSDVYSNDETKRILGALADGNGVGGGMVFNNYGTITNETPEASQAFWDRFNRISELATQGVPTNG